MSRTAAIFIVLTVWAAAYLPWLGSSEFRSEEGHRVMPALEMLESGNYLVPHVAGQPYLRKPPLINWIVAGSFKVFGIRNEWTARLPSTFFVLAVALALVTFARSTLGARGSIISALCWLTSLGVMEKGRMIEIEAVYISLFALALICWLIWWQQNRSPWLTWVVPWIFLGLSLLAKGPGNLFFFYCIVGAVLWRTGRLRELIQPAHLTGVLLMLGIFAAWVVPYFLELRAQDPLQTWSREAAAAFRGEEGRSEEWSLNFPRGLVYFLPWALLLPFVRFSKITDVQRREVARGLAWGSLVPFVIVLLLPGTIPRYVLPLILPIAWLIGIAFAADAFEWRLGIKTFQVRVSRKVIGSCVAIFALGAVIIHPVRSALYLKYRQRIKPIAAKINAAIPPGESLYAVNPGFAPYLLYVHAPVTYLKTLDELPPDARYFLVQPNEQHKVERSKRWGLGRPRLLERTTRYRSQETMLFVVERP